MRNKKIILLHIKDKWVEKWLLSYYRVRPTDQQLEPSRIIGVTGAALSALMSTPGVTSTSLLTSEFTLTGNRQYCAYN